MTIWYFIIFFLVKKSKKQKNKGQTLQLADFLGTVSSVSQVNVTKNISWGDECDREEIVSVNLPTAPRSTRVFDDTVISRDPPFIAHLSNLPYDLNDYELQQYFEEQLECEIESVRLPRDDKEGGRMRGYGYVVFREREDLIAALSLPDPQIGNRHIRIDISNENEQRRNNSRRGYDNFGNEGNSGGNWRRDDGPRGQDEERDSGRRSGYYGNRDRPRDNDSGQDNSNWRSEPRPITESPPPARRNFQDRGEGGNDRFNRDNRDRERFTGRRNNGYDERRREEPVLEEDRPKLRLNPRTLPLSEIEVKPDDDKSPEREAEPLEEVQQVPRPKPVPAASIFGAAKPVDTAAKDRQIEERLEKARLEKKALEEKEQEEKEKEEKEEKEKDKEEKENPEENDEKETLEEKSTEKPSEITPDENSAAKEPVSWRRKTDDEAEPSRTQSPPRGRGSPNRNRNRRNNGKFTCLIMLLHSHFN